MQPKINQAGGLPRLAPGGKSFSMSRAKILDGSIYTFFGPGQLPNCASGAGLRMADDLESKDQPGGDVSTEIDRVYTPPSDWPKAGSLLRVPQVVWLGFYFPFWDYRFAFHYDAADFSVGTLETWVGPLIGDTGPNPASGPPPATIQVADALDYAAPHPEVAESERIKGVFSQVKDQIEQLRPGRTWVSVLDWHDTEDTGNAGYAIANNWPVLSAPPYYFVGMYPYFGTNFLHIFAGAPFEDRKIEADDYVRLDSSALKFSTLGGNQSFGQSSERLNAAAAHFAGFRVAIYYSDFTEESESDAPSYEFTVSGSVAENYPEYELPAHSVFTTPGPGPGTYLVFGGSPSVQKAAWVGLAQAEADIITTNRQFDLLAYPAATSTYFAANAALSGLIASSLGWDDSQGPNPVGVEGATSELDVDSLVKLIADHFKFDPETGEDIG